MNDLFEKRKDSELRQALTLANHTIYKHFLSQLEQYPLVEPELALLDEKPEDCIRLLHLEEFSNKKGEDIFQKLSTVYYASMSLGCNLIVMVDVEYINAPVKIYLGVRNSDIDEQARMNLGTSFRTLENGILSNFPGTRMSKVQSQEQLPKLIDDIFGSHSKYISSVSCVAAVRDKSKTENKNFIQGLEKFVDAMQGYAYTAVFIAEPISKEEQASIRNGYESLYSTLSSFQKSTWSFSENESTAVMESLSTGMSKSVTEGSSQTQAHTVSKGINESVSHSASANYAKNHSQTVTDTKPKKISIIGNLIPVLGGAFRDRSHSEALTDSVTDTIGKSFGTSQGASSGTSRSDSDSVSHNESFTDTETSTHSSTDTKGRARVLQIENINKPVAELLKRVEEHLNRVQEGEDYGAYSCGAYFLSGKQESSLLAANTYRALMIGEGSSVESGTINAWNGQMESGKEIVSKMKEYLCRFTHPIFALPIRMEGDQAKEFLTYTPATVVSGKELPLHLGLPTKSVYGLPVLEYAEFGRNVIYKDQWQRGEEKIKLGRIYHMGQIEKKSSVEMDLQNLAAHTFVTGSTGSGKSNTVYQMLRELKKQGVHFLVIEPAKGEYKHVFAQEDVQVYGTNPYYTPLLKINPFRFPKGIHVLEHIDRLIEIFNVCWPMYAAMPAVLKDSVERAYVNAGWNLATSVNKYDDTLFPSFADVLNELNKVVAESAFSQEVKDNYVGSLSTRIKSLTNGIYGRIFENNEYGDAALFEENVIIDLSRIGSMETKSMVMGILVMRLQEYRMTSGAVNARLRHVTVLEEAHNLLKKTSAEQSSESANLLGKSVEMLSNAIAEVRTYGEGFIIVDQAPGLLDMSAIRNTNTKIIMRLPDAEDRNLVGKSANLSEEQIKELAKIPTGVAAVYQNNWLEPVLCQVGYEKAEGAYQMAGQPAGFTDNSQKAIIQNLLHKAAGEKLERSLAELTYQVVSSALPTYVKIQALHLLKRNGAVSLSDISPVVYDMVCRPEAEQEAERADSIEEWKDAFVYAEGSVLSEFDEDSQNTLVECILREQIQRFEKPEQYLETWRQFVKGEVV